jgi:hypothetical protein
MFTIFDKRFFRSLLDTPNFIGGGDFIQSVASAIAFFASKP